MNFVKEDLPEHFSGFHEFSWALIRPFTDRLLIGSLNSLIYMFSELVLCFSAPFALSEMPEPNETGPPKNGSHCAVLFSDHRNGFKPTALVNGRVDNEMIVTWNGYHDTETNNTRPERTVGHGRPRCHSQPIRFRSLSESASEDHGNGQGLGINRAMVG